MTSTFDRFFRVFFSISVSLVTTQNIAYAQSFGSSFAEHHPRRAQVLSADASLKNQIKQDAGNLGGQYSQLQNTANGIRAQEQQYAQQNGGFITIPQWQQLDNEEAALQNSINNNNSQANVQNTNQENPWQDFNPNTNLPPQPANVPSDGLLSISGGSNGQACGWAGNSGFSAAGTSRLLPSLPPTSTSSVDLNTAY